VNNYGDIVVGYDGSKGARRAVEFAAAEAAAHQARLRIVTVWNRDVPAVAALSPLAMPTVAADRRRIADDRLVEAEALALAIAPDLEVVTAALEGSAPAQLAAATENARLLVVGTRGHHGVQELLLGSVSHACVLHASCPVLVVPPRVDATPPVRSA
jgi:nucleotide-binding universal stress UspA family protein